MFALVGAAMILSLFFFQCLQITLLIALAPLIKGWISQNHAWLSNKKGAGLFQPYNELHKLFLKEPVLAKNSSFLFRLVPYIYFSAMCLMAAIIPVLCSDLALSSIADVIALIGLFGLARIFLAFAAMDIGTAFGSMGARREMFIAFLAEPALLIIFFNVALINQSTSLTVIVANALTGHSPTSPSLVFATVAFFMVLLAENGRIPVDNPATHLELTMIHKAMILEYSGRHLALIEWASQLKLLNYFVIAIALFCPWGIVTEHELTLLPISFLTLVLKLIILSSSLAIFETLAAKFRLFRAPEFLTIAFILAIFAVLTQLTLMG